MVCYCTRFESSIGQAMLNVWKSEEFLGAYSNTEWKGKAHMEILNYAAQFPKLEDAAARSRMVQIETFERQGLASNVATYKKKKHNYPKEHSSQYINNINNMVYVFIFWANISPHQMERRDEIP